MDAAASCQTALMIVHGYRPMSGSSSRTRSRRRIRARVSRVRVAPSDAAQDRGDVTAREAVGRQQERGPVVGRQSSERPLDDVLTLGADRLLLRALGRPADGQHGLEPLRDRHPTTPAGDQVGRHRIQPGTDVVGRPAGLDLPEQPDEGLLGQVLGGIRVTRRGPQEAVDVPLVRVVGLEQGVRTGRPHTHDLHRGRTRDHRGGTCTARCPRPTARCSRAIETSGSSDRCAAPAAVRRGIGGRSISTEMDRPRRVTRPPCYRDARRGPDRGRIVDERPRHVHASRG